MSKMATKLKGSRASKIEQLRIIWAQREILAEGMLLQDDINRRTEKLNFLHGKLAKLRGAK